MQPRLQKHGNKNSDGARKRRSKRDFVQCGRSFDRSGGAFAPHDEFPIGTYSLLIHYVFTTFPSVAAIVAPAPGPSMCDFLLSLFEKWLTRNGTGERG